MLRLGGNTDRQRERVVAAFEKQKTTAAVSYTHLRRGDLLLGQHTGYLGRTVPGKAEVVYLLNYGCSFLVNNEIFVLVHEVAIHRFCLLYTSRCV